jgi:hypothetical protein
VKRTENNNNFAKNQNKTEILLDITSNDKTFIQRSESCQKNSVKKKSVISNNIHVYPIALCAK